MGTKELVIAAIIHLVIPLACIAAYIWLWRQMRKELISDKPLIEYLALFASYGTLLIVVLTSLFWKWSAWASLGTFFLIIFAPIAMILIARRTRHQKQVYKYHLVAYESAMAYFIIAPLLFIFLISIG